MNIDCSEAEKHYVDRELEFKPAPVEVKQQILQAEDFNISELDSIYEVWKKTERAIKALDDKEAQKKRFFKSIIVFCGYNTNFV